MSNFWTPIVNPVLDGEPVNAEISDRPTRQLAHREDFLFQQYQSLSNNAGRLVKTEAALSSDVVQGDIVYFNSQTQRFSKAIAEITYDTAGDYIASERSFAVGLVLSADGSGLGDVLLQGVILPSAFGISSLNLIDSIPGTTFTPGIYYLSRQLAGKISSAPSAPAVQLGYFSDGMFVFAPLYRDIFDSHFHYSFVLSVKPSASQNYARTGWSSFGNDSDPAALRSIDYFNRGTATLPPQIIATIRSVGGAVSSIPQRVEIYRNDSTHFGIDLISGVGLDYTNPASTALTATLNPQLWPNYGEYFAVGDTGLEVAFLRRDQDYSNSLTTDAASLLTVNTDRFKFFLPNDLTGWTNVNQFDLRVPADAKYRYLIEGQPALDRVFPPIPTESVVLELDGVSLDPLTKFKVDQFGLWWMTTGTSAPWATDYSTDSSALDPANAIRLRLYFTRLSNTNSHQFVETLQSASKALTITRCSDGLPAITGRLQIGLDLALAVADAPQENKEFAFVQVDGETFSLGPIVSELIEGAGIKIDRVSTISGSRKIGKLQISRKDVNLEGDVTSIALRNAKEVIRDSVTYVEFVEPSKVPSSIVARFKLPAADLATGTIKLNLFGQFLGLITVGSTTTFANFKLTYHALRPGFNLGSLNEGTALKVQYWRVAFQNYTGLSILPEFPVTASDYVLTTANLNPSSLVLPDGLANGDIISVSIERVVNDASSNVDTYSGRVGLVGLRWAITT